MGALIGRKIRKDKDEEAFSIKEKKKNQKSFFGSGARTRWVTERIASMKQWPIE